MGEAPPARLGPAPRHHVLHHVLGQCDQAHVVLGVAAGLGVTHYVNGILLGLQPCG